MVDNYISVAVNIDVVPLAAEFVGLYLDGLILAAYISIRRQIGGAGDDIVVIILGIGVSDVALGLDIDLVVGNYLVYLGILKVNDVYIIAHGTYGIGIGVNGFFLGTGVAADTVETQVLSGEAGLSIVIGGVDTSKRVYPYLVGGHGVGIQSILAVALNIDAL